MIRIRVIALLAWIMLIQVPEASAKKWDPVSKQKKVHHEYKVQDMDRLDVDNMYGKVHINTWDKNEVTVDITVTAKARTDGEAQEVLDRIDFVISGNEDGGHRISYKTILGNMRHNIQNSEMTIDYTINAPKRNALDITNKYGDVYLGDFMGKMRMDVSYGALDLQNITGSGKKIKVAFGSASVASIETGIFDISYSNLTIDKAIDIDVTNKFGNTDITSVQNLKVEQMYGSISVASVNQVSGMIDYANLEVDQLNKSADLALKYCGKADFKSISDKADLLELDAHYSSIFCHLAENSNMAIDISTSYSSVKRIGAGRALDIQNRDPDDNNGGRYMGKTGHGDGKLNIHAHYSNVEFK